jgi:hypothetical protein
MSTISLKIAKAALGRAEINIGPEHHTNAKHKMGAMKAKVAEEEYTEDCPAPPEIGANHIFSSASDSPVNPKLVSPSCFSRQPVNCAMYGERGGDANKSRYARS